MKDDKCFWHEEDDEGYWESGCSRTAFAFNDGGPKENNFKFCPYCGKELEEDELDEINEEAP